MEWRGGGGTDGTQGGGYPAACSEVRIVNAGGGIMECLTVQQACARGLVSGPVCASSAAASSAANGAVSASSLGTAAQLSSPAATTLPLSPLVLDPGCLFCGGFLVLFVIGDLLFGTNLILRRRKA